ncbi:MAG: hypothetical protein IJD84_10065 [Parabacteroides sp.]|nr:hypothetical protein [Parabacteroides sp.]
MKITTSFLFSISILLLLCIGLACRPQTNPILLRAEVMMAKQPDKAYHLLKDSILPQQLNKADYATWCLLMTEATDKHLKYHTSDSLIRKAVTYFEKQGSLERKAKAWFYQGALIENSDPIKAVQYYLKAQEYAEQTDDRALQGRLYNRIGNIYKVHGINEEALTYQKRALDCLQQEQDTLGSAYILRDMARIYINLSLEDSALTCYQEGLRMADSTLIYSISKEVGYLYLNRQEYEKAYQYLMTSLQLTHNQRMRYSIYSVLSDYHFVLNQLDSALHYSQICLESSSFLLKSEAYKRMREVAILKGENEKVAKYNTLYETFQDSVNKYTHTIPILNKKNKLSLEQLQTQLTNQKKQNKYSLMALALFGCILIGICYCIWRRKQQTKQSNLSQLVDVHPFINQPIILKFQTSLDDWHPDTEDWQQLFDLLNQEELSFISRLKAKYEKLSLTELKICCLIKIQIPPAQIARLLEVSTNYIYMVRTRLYEKIHKQKGKAKDLDMFILNL